ncbi:hypothetical protein [Candidatus Pantoea persica]|uniref:hypothetical protein n=1 Tax=Candidatus Pantoea persica TaxID=2518128 RepID=UPI0035A8A504|nr:c-di-GMP phosphodiesterase [Candidatus Pantoea persica]
MLATDNFLLKGSPILLLWTPKSLDNRSGTLQVINIELMSSSATCWNLSCLG